MINNISSRLKQGKAIRRSLKEWGRLHIDRLLPFLVLYRQTQNTLDWGTEYLVTSEASYAKLPSPLLKECKNFLIY